MSLIYVCIVTVYIRRDVKATITFFVSYNLNQSLDQGGSVLLDLKKIITAEEFRDGLYLISQKTFLRFYLISFDENEQYCIKISLKVHIFVNIYREIYS